MRPTRLHEVGGGSITPAENRPSARPGVRWRAVHHGLCGPDHSRQNLTRGRQSRNAERLAGGNLRHPDARHAERLVQETTAGAATIEAGAGTFSLSGVAAGLTAARKLTAEAVSFALTGNDTALSGQHKLSAASSSFALTGNAAGLSTQGRSPLKLANLL